MKRINQPSAIDFPPQITGDQRLRLQLLITRAVREAAGAAAINAASISDTTPRTHHTARERFSAQMLSADRDGYAIPSFDGGGAPKELPVKQPGQSSPAPPRLRWRHPKGSVAADQVLQGGSPFAQQLIAIFPGWRAVRVQGERYAVAYDLSRALTWGNLLFGARSFAILEGPLGKPNLRYYVVGTNHALHVADGGPGKSIAGGQVWGLKARIHWQMQLQDAQRDNYMLRALFTAEGQPMWPMSRELAEEFYGELQRGRPLDRWVPPALARPLIFGEIDRLIGAQQIEEAARRLAELDANAFALVDWTVKAGYLAILADAWTLEAEEKAIVELLKSMRGRSELDAALELLKKKGKLAKLFRDMNSQLWSLLIVVGRQFGDPAPFSYRQLVNLLQEAGLVPRDWKEIARKITVTPTGVAMGDGLFLEAEEAARSFVEFLGGALEGILMLVTHPDKLLEGIGQLVKLSVMIQLAEMGHPPAVGFVGAILKQMSRQVTDGLKGAAVLGLGESLVRRIKWAILWEVASWFIGIGEIKAAISGAGVTERLAALGRLLRVLRLLGRAAEAEQAATKLERLARLLQKISIISHEDEVLRLFSHLPEQDLVRIAERLESADIHALQNMAELAAKHPELAEAARHALGRAEALQRLEARAGHLSDNLIEGFQKLAGRSGFNNTQLFDLMAAVPAEHAELYMQVVRAMPAHAFGPGIGGRSFSFFQNLTQRPRAMRFMAESGYESFSALLRHGNYDFVRFEENLQALEDLLQKIPVEQRAVEYQRMLERLNQGERALLDELRNAANARRAAAGQPLLRSFSAAELDELVRTTPDIRQIRRLAAQMDNSSAGSLFERWVHKHVFGQQIGAPRVRLHVRAADNPHLEHLWQDRIADVYYRADGSVWDAKIYQTRSEIDVLQLDDYRKMEEAGFVINGAGQRQPVSSINYIFSDRAAAELNKVTLHVEGGAEAWFIDDHGVLQHLP